MGARANLDERIGTHAVLVENVLREWERSTEEHKRSGRTWYVEAHEIARELTPYDVRIGAGVLAVLSPQKSWADNVEIARRSVEAGAGIGSTGLFCHRASEIIAGADPWEILGGPKVRPFYGLIVEPEHPTFVVVDRHAYDVAQGRVTCDAERKALELVGGPAWVQAAFRTVAALVGERPSAVQAATWIEWRRRKGIPERLSVIVEPEPEPECGFCHEPPSACRCWDDV